MFKSLGLAEGYGTFSGLAGTCLHNRFILVDVSEIRISVAFGLLSALNINTSAKSLN